MATTMRWERKVPTEPGWYWRRKSGMNEGVPSIVDVDVDYMGRIAFANTTLTREDAKGYEWSGPVAVPLEPLRPNQCCRTCGHWDIEKAKDSAGKVKRHADAPCLWRPTETYPESSLGPRATAYFLRKVRCDDGGNCMCWIPRAKTEGER